MIDLLSLIVVLCIAGAALWAINKYIPMQPTIKKILNFVVVAAVIVWLLSVFGILGHITNIQVGK